MKEDSMKYFNPYLKEELDDEDNNPPKYKVNFEKGIEPDTVYVHTTKFTINAHRERPLVRVSMEKGSGFIIRKVVGKRALDGEYIAFDTLSFKEVTGKSFKDFEEPISLEVKKASFLDRYYHYFKRHPKDDIRLAYNLFLIGVAIATFSILLTIYSLNI